MKSGLKLMPQYLLLFKERVSNMSLGGPQRLYTYLHTQGRAAAHTHAKYSKMKGLKCKR